MFVVVTYDVDVKRIDRVRKTLRKYLCWVQNSVFEGEITVSNLARCKAELSQIIEEEDSVYFYVMKGAPTKEVLGVLKNPIEDIL